MKVRTDENLADAMTKPGDGGGLKRHIEGVGCWIAQGRHKEMPGLDAERDEGRMTGTRKKVKTKMDQMPRGRHGDWKLWKMQGKSG